MEIKVTLFWKMKEKFWQKKPKTHSRKAHLLVKLTNVQKTNKEPTHIQGNANNSYIDSYAIQSQ